MNDSVGHSPSDQEFLDQVLDLAMERLEDGEDPSPRELAAERPDLLDSVRAVIERARGVAVTGRQSHGAPGHQPPAIPGYRILRELGRGGMGAVYLAEQVTLGGRPVALKTLPGTTSLSSQAHQRFRHEASAIARVRHPNIVAVHDVIEVGDVAALAMEWVDGRSLAQLIERVRDVGSQSGRSRDAAADMDVVREALSAPAGAIVAGSFPVFVCGIGISIARALQAVHDLGLVHRDVKPSNILIRRDGMALLTDFGLVRDAGAATITQGDHFVGTPAYAAPEQLAGGHERLDARSDVYALGVTLYHALALRLPFRGQTSAEVLRQVESGACEPLRKSNPRLPRDLETIIAKAMEVDPSRRYGCAAELADDLERLGRFQPIRARRAGIVNRASKLMKRNRAALAGAIVGGVLTVLLAAALVIYLVLVPRWVKESLDEARLTLLDPGRTMIVHNVLFWGESGGSRVSIDETVCVAALAAYDRALRWKPWDDHVRLERDVVALALRFGRSAPNAPEISEEMSRRVPATCRYVRAWAERGLPLNPLVPGDEAPAANRPPAFLPAAPGSGSTDPSRDIAPADLRALGLLAYLCGDVRTALSAWSALDLVADPDPLVETTLGLMYLIDEQPARAYPRLRNAFIAYPEAGWVGTSLADAAAQCGDVSKAEQVLETSQRLEQSDALAIVRVGIMVDLAAGRVAKAEAAYAATRYDFDSGWTHVLGYQYARWMEAHGRTHDALREYAHASFSGMVAARPARAFVAAMNRWWSGLSSAARWRAWLSAFDDRSGAEDAISSMLLLYATLSDSAASLQDQRPAATVGSSGDDENQTGLDLQTLASRLAASSVQNTWDWILALPTPCRRILAFGMTTPFHAEAVEWGRMSAGVLATTRRMADKRRRVSAPGHWTLVAAGGTSPEPREGAAMAFDSKRQRCLLAGGVDCAGRALMDAWAWDGEDWTLIAAKGPALGILAGLVYDNFRDRIIIVGRDGTDESRRTWEFDGVDWTCLGFSNRTIRLSLCVFDQNRRVCIAAPMSPMAWIEWDGNGWTARRIAAGGASVAGYGARGIFDSLRGHVVAFGGTSGSSGMISTERRTVLCDGTAWHELPMASSPSGRIEHGMAYDSARDRVVVFGGVESRAPALPLNDTWEFDGSGWNCTGTGRNKSQGQPPAAVPSPRAGHAMVFDAAHAQVIVFGGRGIAGIDGQTWIYHGPPTTPPKEHLR